MIKKTNQTSDVTSEEPTILFWLMGAITIIGSPFFLVVLHEVLGGGIFNGFAGSWQEPIIDPRIIVFGINPLLMLSSYGLLLFQFIKYLQLRKKSYLKIAVAICVVLLATVVTTAMVFAGYYLDIT